MAYTIEITNYTSEQLVQLANAAQESSLGCVVSEASVGMGEDVSCEFSFSSKANLAKFTKLQAEILGKG